MLTPQQIADARQQLGIPEKGINTLEPTGAALLSELRKSVPEKRNVAEKIASVTGGEELGQGLGQAIAMGKNAQGLEDAQSNTIKIQGDLIARIKDKKSRGEDTSRLQGALDDITTENTVIANQTENVLNPNQLTGKQVIGDALQLGTTVLGAGQLPGAAKNVVAAETFGKGALQGAKTGAIAGGIYGASSGVSNALQEDKNAGGIIKGGIGGALVGAGTGGILGAAIGGTTGAIRGVKAAKATKEADFTLDLVSPKATEQVKQQALREGRVTEQTLLGGGKITASNRDKQLAEAVQGVISPKNSPIQNIDALNTKVSDINTGVKAYIRANKTPFNTNQLTTQLNKGKDELKLVFAGDKQSEKTYNAVVKEFLKHVEKKDTAGLFEARQGFDKVPAIKKLLDSQGLGENAKKEIVLTVRGQANKYIASLLPKGNQYREALLRESKMIEAIGNIADKNTSIIGTNGIQALTKKYPVLNWLAGGIGAGLVGGGSIGIGRSIIGSSD